MNLYHLRYFAKLAELEHYTRAAEELMITQPSLSHAISQIERELKVKLFEKEGRNIVLTKFGRMFLQDVSNALNILDSGIKTMQMISNGEGHIELGFLRTLGLNYIPELTRDFVDTNKDKAISFNFHTGITSELIQGLKDKQYDLIFCSKVENEPRIDFHPVAAQDLILIVPEQHPLADKQTVHLKETLPYPQIFFSRRSGLRYIIDNMFNQIGEKPNIAYEVVEDQVIAGLVANDFGIAVCPKMDILSSMPVKIINIESPNVERNFYLAVLKDNYQAPVVNEFMQFAIEHTTIPHKPD